MSQQLKIIFAGLDKSGKTSIIYGLKNRFSLSKTRPTLGVDQQSIKETKWMKGVFYEGVIKVHRPGVL
jgi:GTPase SAR1 family protein